MRPIPKCFLKQKVTYHKQVQGNDFYDENTIDDGIVIRRVRVEQSNMIIRDKNNVEIKLSAIMFYDCISSYPRNIHFIVDDVIIFKETEKYKIVNVEPLYDEKQLHHYELGLVKYV